MRFITNLRFHDNGERSNPLMFLFLFINFVFGAGFLLLHGSDSIQATVFAKQSHQIFGDETIYIWAAAILATTLGQITSIGLRLRAWISRFAYSGFLLWWYAVIVYTMGGYWFQLLAGAIPNMLFWAWFWLDIKAYERANGINAKLKK